MKKKFHYEYSFENEKPKLCSFELIVDVVLVEDQSLDSIQVMRFQLLRAR